ncbi:MAG: LysM peptidoglycan-binding domain-containing protein [Rectinema subterraneum]|uniref:LysM peptidoglycan-binding domain-containing protein n=1 Tax=Rectinema subterraneum TaxID=2653714 RepID=UPI003C7E0A5E
MARRAVVIAISLLSLFFMPLGLCGAEQEYHVIQSGETLYSIAKSYSVPYEMLASINGITDPSKIRPGTVLLIPLVHVVAKGETFFGIAKKYDVSIQELKTANSLSDSYVLRVGDVLVIPDKGVAAAAPSQPAPAQPAPVAASPADTAPPSSAKPTSATPAATIPAAPPSAPAAASPADTAPPSSSNSNSKNASAASRTPDAFSIWPVEGKGQYMSGKLEGIMFQTTRGAPVKAVASGTVVSAGPSRGFGDVVFIQSKSGFVYVYGGNESILVKTGENVEPGKTIGRVGIDAKDGTAIAYFFVFRNGQPIDPSLAPRD